MTHGFQCFIYHIGPLKVVVRKEINLVEEISNIYAAHWVHLRERKYTRKSTNASVDRQQGVVSLSYANCSRGLSGVYQLTLTTLSYSSMLLIGMGM